jgi:hypothetical protein
MPANNYAALEGVRLHDALQAASHHKNGGKYANDFKHQLEACSRIFCYVIDDAFQYRGGVKGHEEENKYAGIALHKPAIYTGSQKVPA